MGGHSEEGKTAGEDGEVVSFEYPSRALTKCNRAAELFGSLEQEVDRWNEEHQLMAPARSPYDGDPRIEFFRPVAVGEIPWQSWESVFHDGVSNLRVALDTFCFELCHTEQAPSKPGDIHFPITEHPNEWPEWTKRLSAMPTSLLDRVRQCQPWARPDPQDPDPLKLVSRINNMDKHRAAGVTFDVMPAGQWALRPSAPIPEELDGPDWPLEPWMAMTLDPPVERGFAELAPVMAVPILMFEGLFANLPDGQRWLHCEVRRMIEFIASGEWPEADIVEHFLPGPVWSVWPSS